ncbi:MAG: ATP-binding protein [Hydrogenophilus sp.]|nr:ATP-binding protein [Hydrogenophilus sp.]
MERGIAAEVAAGVAFGYLLLLFGVAFWADRLAEQGRSVIGRAWVYTLSIGVYCTAWTFFGSVGVAAREGVWFLPIYLGPTAVMLAAPWVVVPFVRAAKAWRATSLADLLGARFGHHAGLARAVSLALMVAVIPYVALQIKAIALAFEVVSGGDGGEAARTFWLVVVLTVFAVLFGTRRLDVTEHHEGLVAAVALESAVKLVAFWILGGVVVWAVTEDEGWRAQVQEGFSRLPRVDEGERGYGDWLTMVVLSAAAFVVLPRQFQMMVIENVKTAHVYRAAWQFPLYLLGINAFVLPVAVAGGVVLGEEGSADTYVLALPLVLGAEWLALVAFVGGISAATSMVIVESVAVATMWSNEWLAPWWLRRGRPLAGRVVLWVRRGAIAGLLGLGYLFYQAVGASYALAAIGLVSFAGVAQLVPALVAAFAWPGASAIGVMAGLLAGLTVWGYTALVPLFIKGGWLPETWLTMGPAGIEALRPTALFGVEGMAPITGSVVWSWLANVGTLLVVSWFYPPDRATRRAAERFAALWRGEEESTLPAARGVGRPYGAALEAQLVATLGRFVETGRLQEAWREFRRQRGVGAHEVLPVDETTVAFAERLLAGAIGGVAARLVIEGALGERAPAWDSVMAVVEEARAVRLAHERLREVDRLKDEFVASVSHELRTPLTAIRTLAELLAADPDMERSDRLRFYETMVRESERLSRLINQVLDLAKLEAGGADWRHEAVDLRAVTREVIETVTPLAAQQGVVLTLAVPERPAVVWGDRDRLVQVLMNVVGNAVKFAPPSEGRVQVQVERVKEGWQVAVDDNGPGVPPEERERIFERFRQGQRRARGVGGTGLGLAIARRIVELLGGMIRVEDSPLGGARFIVVFPEKQREVVGGGAFHGQTSGGSG